MVDLISTGVVIWEESPLTGDSYLNLPREHGTFIVAPILPVGGAMLLYGAEKLGKSFLAIQLAEAIVTGKSWMGFPIHTPGPVVYVQLDTPRGLWVDRLLSIEEAGLEVRRVDYEDPETLPWPFDILNPEHALRLRSALQALPVPPIAVIIDVLKEAHQEDENSATAMQKVIAAITNVVKPSAFILVHHGRKINPDQPDDIRVGSRGTNYVTGRMDGIVLLTESAMQYVGRSVEHGSIALERLGNGLWQAPNVGLHAMIEEVLALPGPMSGRARARVLAEKLGKSEEAAKSLLARYGKEHNDGEE